MKLSSVTNLPSKLPRQKLSASQLIIRRLRTQYGNPGTFLKWEDPLELLVSTILSAQCTDVRVNQVTPALFATYRNAHDFAQANLGDLEALIRSTGFYKNKAKNIKQCCISLVQNHEGKVPRTMKALTDLPGVGRKTANCVLGAAFGIQEGIVVDTHVVRLSRRLGFSQRNNPEKIEEDLLKIIPATSRYSFSNWLILHGRRICVARKPKCNVCFLNDLCPSTTSLAHVSIASGRRGAR